MGPAKLSSLAAVEAPTGRQRNEEFRYHQNRIQMVPWHLLKRTGAGPGAAAAGARLLEVAAVLWSGRG